MKPMRNTILLGGPVLNMLWNLWWADALPALVMVPIIVKEGIGGLRNKPCC